MKLQAPALTAALICVALAFGLAGCGSDDGGGGAGQPAPQAVCTVAGVVLNAADTSKSIAYAEVAVEPDGPSTTADAAGAFTLTGVPAGQFTLVVRSGPTGAYWTTRMPLEGGPNEVINVVVTLVPQSMPQPDRLVVAPEQVELDPGAQQQFTAFVYSGGVQLDVAPSWAVRGQAGTITADGTFTAAQPGTATVIAVAGSSLATAAVTVTQPRPPVISSAFVDPTTHPAQGGQSIFTCRVRDGDGVAQVVVEVYKPDSSVEEVPLVRTAGTDKDGTWSNAASPYTFPPNSNAPDESGYQAPQVYDVRFKAVDNSGQTGYSDFVEVTVQGIPGPPPQP